MAKEVGEDVKLIGMRVSPFVLRAKVGLNLIGVEYELLEETFGKKSELLLKSNPIYKKVPVLLHVGQPVCESLIILQYIDEVWGAPGSSILPSDLYDRAVARFWGTCIEDKVVPNVRQMLRAETEEDKSEVAEKLISGLVLAEEAFEKFSKGKTFFGGDNIGYVDIVLGSFLRWIEVAGILSGKNMITEENTPLLHGWAGHFCEHSAVRNDLPATEECLTFLLLDALATFFLRCLNSAKYSIAYDAFTSFA